VQTRVGACDLHSLVSAGGVEEDEVAEGGISGLLMGDDLVFFDRMAGAPISVKRTMTMEELGAWAMVRVCCCRPETMVWGSVWLWRDAAPDWRRTRVRVVSGRRSCRREWLERTQRISRT
jgi:hypothetical protein